MTLDVFSLDGKVALVTGASRGLGAATAAALATAGAAVALHSNEQPATQTAERICNESGRRTELFTADLADRAAADALFAETIAAFGKVDILVNNAGIIRRKAAAQHSDEDWDAVIEVNLSNAFRLCRAMGKHLIDTGAPGKNHQRRVTVVVPGRRHRSRLRRGEGRPRPAHEGARERVGGSRHQRQRHRARLHADRQHQGAA